MTKTIIKKFFNSALCRNYTNLYCTPDDKVFTDYNKAVEYCLDNLLNPYSIVEWFKEWSNSDNKVVIKSRTME